MTAPDVVSGLSFGRSPASSDQEDRARRALGAGIDYQVDDHLDALDATLGTLALEDETPVLAGHGLPIERPERCGRAIRTLADGLERE